MDDLSAKVEAKSPTRNAEPCLGYLPLPTVFSVPTKTHTNDLLLCKHILGPPSAGPDSEVMSKTSAKRLYHYRLDSIVPHFPHGCG